MCSRHQLAVATAVLFAASILTSCKAACIRASPTKAVVGEELRLSCSLDSLCFGDYEWTLVGTDNNETQSETGSKLLVSENVTPSEDVGGRLYECACGSDHDNCQLFKIGVIPVAELKFSPGSVARNGSSVSITCTAESYPAADKVSDYALMHNGQQLSTQLLPGRNGVHHGITSVNKDTDSGIYECVVTITFDGEPLQGDKANTHLTIYYPPSISCHRNDTVAYVPAIVQTAVLECAVDNSENLLQVSVNWTMTDGRKIKKEHNILALQKSTNVSYLMLYNVSESEDNNYSCNVYSKYGLEATQMIKVIISDGACRNDNCSEDNVTIGKCLHLLLIFAPPVLIVLGVVITGFILFNYNRKRIRSLYNNIKTRFCGDQETKKSGQSM
jgi:hypothetical protein